jgi:hypothetical protein
MRKALNRQSKSGQSFEEEHHARTRAIGRSKLEPSFRTSAGAKLIVIRFPCGQRRALLEMAEVTRSLLSLTAVSGSPATAILSVLLQPAWTSISTSKASTPTTAELLALPVCIAGLRVGGNEC